ncbi:MAG: hypothetical protein R3F61_23685 [Myxococcota bacterium]
MTVRGPVYVQLGLFGGTSTIDGMHVVAAHTRVRADGTEVFVAEHLRWNRGRQARPMPMFPKAPPRSDQQPLLFGPQSHCLEEVEVWPGAWQLPLWPAEPR